MLKFLGKETRTGITLASVSFPTREAQVFPPAPSGCNAVLSANPRLSGQVFPRQLRSETQHDYRCGQSNEGDKVSWSVDCYTGRMKALVITRFSGPEVL